MPILIKRYANRKLYNTQTSRYITLKGIAELIESDEEVRVIDNESGEDITSVALSQILVDNEREGRRVSRPLLSGLLQRGGDALYGALRRGVGDASEGLGEIQRNVRRMVRRHDDEGGGIGDWISHGAPDLENVLQNTVERVFKLLDLPRRSDIDALNRNLDRVARAIEALDQTPSGALPDDATPAPRPAKPSA